MQFLKTLFWVALAVILVLFAVGNWKSVTLTLWGGLLVDVNLPLLVLTAFLLGLLPTLIVQRARIWSLKRRLEPHERNAALATSTTPVVRDPGPAPIPVAMSNQPADEQRLATDTKIWP